jgi:hypothetical protein
VRARPLQLRRNVSDPRDMVELSREAAEYLSRMKCRVVPRPTPDIIRTWNALTGPAVGLFHVTC